MTGIKEQLVSARYFLTAGHFVAHILCLLTVKNNVSKYLNDSESIDGPLAENHVSQVDRADKMNIMY